MPTLVGQDDQAVDRTSPAVPCGNDRPDQLTFGVGDQHATGVMLEECPERLEVVRVRGLRGRQLPQFEDPGKIGVEDSSDQRGHPPRLRKLQPKGVAITRITFGWHLPPTAGSEAISPGRGLGNIMLGRYGDGLKRHIADSRAAANCWTCPIVGGVRCQYVSVLIESAADELIATASRLSEPQLLDLARATRRAMGRSPAAYLGLVAPSSALRAASAVGKEAGREALLKHKELALTDAVLSAATVAATLAGRDTTGVRVVWDQWKVAVESGNARQQKGTFRASRRAFRRGLGSPLNRRWLMASTGAHWALVALVTWDLAEDHGSYTTANRDELTIPWTSVAPIPLRGA